MCKALPTIEWRCILLCSKHESKGILCKQKTKIQPAKTASFGLKRHTMSLVGWCFGALGEAVAICVAFLVWPHDVLWIPLRPLKFHTIHVKIRLFRKRQNSHILTFPLSNIESVISISNPLYLLRYFLLKKTFFLGIFYRFCCNTNETPYLCWIWAYRF